MSIIARLVMNFAAAQTEIGGGGGANLVVASNEVCAPKDVVDSNVFFWASLPMPCHLAPRLRGVVFLGKPDFRAAQAKIGGGGGHLAVSKMPN
jgi:hypothetical protein